MQILEKLKINLNILRMKNLSDSIKITEDKIIRKE